MRYRNIKKDFGFSTIEMMIAMVIMIMAISAVLMVCFGNQNFLIGGQTNSEAVTRAQELLEQQQSFARKDFRMVNSTDPSFDGYYTTWSTVGPSPTPFDYFTKQITSFVSWKDDSQITRTTQISSLITNFENAIGGDTCHSFLTGNWKNPATTYLTLGTLLGDTTGTYPITDIDVFQKKMYVTVSQSSSATATTIPNTASDSNAIGTVTWSSPLNVKNSDNTRASASLVSGNTTHYIKATNFGFSIPANATITGIKVEIERSINGSSSGGVKDGEVKIIKSNGTLSAYNKADTTTSWPIVTSESFATYNPSDLWGETWSPADINNANFGVAISAVATASRTANIDSIRITISYIKNFFVFDLTNPTAPTFISTLGSNQAITAGYTAIQSDGRFNYIATNSSSGQLQIIDASTTPYLLISTLKIGTSGTSAGNSIFYKNGYVYLGLTNTASGPAEFNIIDVHNPASPILIGSYPIGSAVNSIYVRNNTAYITTSDASKEMLVLDISNPTSPVVSKTFNATPDQSGFGYGRSEYIVGDSWYLGRTYIATAPEYAYIDASGATPTTKQTKDIGPNTTNPFSVHSLIVRDFLAFILTGSGTKGGQLQIINATSTTQYAPPISLPNTNSGMGGISLDCEGNYVYASSIDAGNIGYITVVTAH